jgi:peptide/nickel transport system substrate-binding protein
MRRGAHVVALMTTIALAAAGCGSDNSSSAPPGTTAAGASTTSTAAGTTASASGSTTAAASDKGCTADRAGGAITVGTFGALTSFDPVASPASGTGGGVEMAAIYDTLMRWNPDTGKHEPRVAQSLEPNADFTQWTLKLRPGVKFGDGAPLTAEAVRWNVARHQDPKNNSRALALTQTITGMDVVDDLTLVFHLGELWAQFPYLLANEPGMVINPAKAQALGADFAKMPTGGGVGPYEVTRFAPGEEIVLQAKTDYWDGPVCIGQVRFIRVPGGQATYDAFKKGEVDVALIREPKVNAQVRADGVAYTSTPDSAGAVLLINNGARGTTPPTTDPRLRQAIVHALDVNLYNQRINDGTGKPTSAVISDTSRYYQGLAGPAYDAETAKRLVAEVKAEGKWDGKVSLMCGNTPQGVDTGVLFKGLLEAAGFEVNVESVDQPTSLKRVIVESNYQLACWGFGIREANAWVTLYNNLSSKSLSNYAGYSNPAMDQALDAMKKATSLDGEKAALRTIQDVWNETAPSAVYETSENFTIWKDKVKNIEFTQNWMLYLDDAYVEK